MMMVLGVLLTVVPSLLAVSNYDFYISPTVPGGSTNGSISNPYDGSDKDKFDALMRGFAATNLVEYSGGSHDSLTIHLLSGDFKTWGTGNYTLGDGYTGPTTGWVARSHWKIIGAGRSGVGTTTTLKVEDTFKDPTTGYLVKSGVGVIGTISGSDSSGKIIDVNDITVKDLAVDCNLTAFTNYVAVDATVDHYITKPFSVAGVGLHGRNHTIQNVLVKNAGSYPWSPRANDATAIELFPCFIYVTWPSQSSVSNLITQSEVSSYLGGSCTAINFGGASISGTISSCLVDFTGTPTTLAGIGAYGGYGVHDSTYLNNVSYGGDHGFNIDSLANGNITIQGNNFHQVSNWGMTLFGSYMAAPADSQYRISSGIHSIYITNNTFNLKNNAIGILMNYDVSDVVVGGEYLSV